MTRSWRGRSRRSNGSIVTRSVSMRCSVPAPSVTGPRRRISVSNAVGQSSSVPSRRPIRWLAEVMASSFSAEAGQVVGDLRAPGGPVVRDVVALQVELVADALLGQAPAGQERARQRAGGVLPLALAADQQQADPRAQPLEVVAVEVRDVVDRAVEVALLAALAPAVAPPGRVVGARQAHGEREQVGALEGEVG